MPLVVQSSAIVSEVELSTLSPETILPGPVITRPTALVVKVGSSLALSVTDPSVTLIVVVPAVV